MALARAPLSSFVCPLQQASSGLCGAKFQRTGAEGARPLEAVPRCHSVSPWLSSGGQSELQDAAQM